MWMHTFVILCIQFVDVCILSLSNHIYLIIFIVVGFSHFLLFLILFLMQCLDDLWASTHARSTACKYNYVNMIGWPCICIICMCCIIYDMNMCIWLTSIYYIWMSTLYVFVFVCVVDVIIYTDINHYTIYIVYCMYVFCILNLWCICIWRYIYSIKYLTYMVYLCVFSCSSFVYVECFPFAWHIVFMSYIVMLNIYNITM